MMDNYNINYPLVGAITYLITCYGIQQVLSSKGNNNKSIKAKVNQLVNSKSFNTFVCIHNLTISIVSLVILLGACVALYNEIYTVQRHNKTIGNIYNILIYI